MQIPSHMEVPQQVEGGCILLRQLVLLQHLAVLKTIYEDNIDFTNWEFHLNQNERIRIEIKTTLHQLLLPIDHWLQLVSNATATRI